MAYTITPSCIGCQSCAKICPSGAISGEKKQAHTIHWDICIECGACGRVCPVGAIKDSFGVPALRIKKKQWKQPVIDMKICMSCGICIDTCPAGALEKAVQLKNNPHAFPRLTDVSFCMGCGFCADDCPVSAITMTVREPITVKGAHKVREKQTALPQEA